MLIKVYTQMHSSGQLAVRTCECTLQFWMLICVADERCKSICAVPYNCLKVHCSTDNSLSLSMVNWMLLLQFEKSLICVSSASCS